MTISDTLTCNQLANDNKNSISYLQISTVVQPPNIVSLEYGSTLQGVNLVYVDVANAIKVMMIDFCYKRMHQSMYIHSPY